MDLAPLSAPTISNLTEICDHSQGFYTVSFTIFGTGPFIVNGVLLANNDNFFISDSIPSGTGYYFEIFHSAHCGEPLIVQGSFNCQVACPISAGTILTNFNYDCEEQRIRVHHNGDQILESDDLLEFVLYEGNDLATGNIIARNDDGIFSFIPGQMVYGRTYRVVAIAGDEIGGQVDLQDQCLSASNEVSIVYYETPKVVNSPGDSLIIDCRIPQVTLAMEISGGSGQFNMQWQGSGLSSDTFELTTALPGWFHFKLLDEATGCVLKDSTLVVEDKVHPEIRFATPLALDCATEQVTIDASQSSQGNVFEYSWLTLDGHFSHDPGHSLRARVDAAGTYILSIHNTRNGCKSVEQIQVIDLNDGIKFVHLDIEEALCNGNKDASLEVLGIVGGTPLYHYTFNGIDYGYNSRFEDLSAGEYPLSIEDDKGCRLDTTVVIADPLAMDDGLEDTYFITLGETLDLPAQPNFVLQDIQWLDQQGNLLSDSLRLIVTPDQTRTYEVILTDQNGCRIHRKILVRVAEPEDLIFIPNAFSPNGDRVNDVLKIYPHPSVRLVRSFTIFSRWGDQAYRCENIPASEGQIACAWDGRVKGRVMNPAIFVYLAEIELIDGTVKTLSGDIALIR